MTGNINRCFAMEYSVTQSAHHRNDYRGIHKVVEFSGSHEIHQIIPLDNWCVTGTVAEPTRKKTDCAQPPRLSVEKLLYRRVKRMMRHKVQGAVWRTWNRCRMWLMRNVWNRRRNVKGIKSDLEKSDFTFVWHSDKRGLSLKWINCSIWWLFETKRFFAACYAWDWGLLFIDYIHDDWLYS